MASTPKFLVYIGATDELSDKLGNIGSKLTGFIDRVTSAGEKISSLGDRMSDWGLKIGLTTALLSEGASKVKEWSDAISEPAFAMEHSMATMGAMTGLGADALSNIREHAIQFSNTHPGVTAEQWADGFTHMREVFQDTGKAMDATDVAGKLKRFGVDSAAAQGLLSSVFANLGTDAKTTADQFVETTKLFGVDPSKTEQFGMVIGRLAGTAEAAHTPLAGIMALAGQAQQMIQGGRGAQVFASMVQELGANAQKTGIDMRHGLVAAFHQVSDELNGLSGTDKLARLKELGFGEEGSLILPWLDNLDKLDVAQSKIAKSSGVTDKTYAAMTANAADKVALLHTNVSNLYDALMAPALPTVNTWLGRFTGLVQDATSAAGHHATAAKWMALGILGVGDAAYYGLQGLSAIGSTVFFVGSATKMLGKFMDVESLALRSMYAWDSIKSVGSGILSLGSSMLSAVPAVWAFAASLSALEILSGVGIILAIAGAAYEIYEHWGHLGEWFSSLWAGVENIFSGVGNWLLGWAPAVGKEVLFGLTGPFGMIGYEIYKHAGSIEAACKKLGGIVESYFVGHSPPPVGPLHNLGRITIAETIAARIRPAPILSAVARTAAAVASAAPTMDGGGVAMAGTGGGGSGGGAPIINYSVSINGTGLNERQLLSVLRDNAYALRQILTSQEARAERTKLG
jgi:hypothetical protein